MSKDGYTPAAQYMDYGESVPNPVRGAIIFSLVMLSIAGCILLCERSTVVDKTEITTTPIFLSQPLATQTPTPFEIPDQQPKLTLTPTWP
ncbi:hypothetical protein ACFLY9_01825 [Patescibacteria group bacterium]